MGQVLIIEDHPLVAEATADLLRARHPAINLAIAHNSADAHQALHSGIDWYRVFLDLDIPGAFGLSIGREIAALGWADRCCVISASPNPGFIQEAKTLGILGYIVKAIPVVEFADSLDRVLRGEASFPAVESSRRQPATVLTRRQTDLLCLARDGRSSKQIARLVGITEGTINNHFNAMLRALAVANRTQAVSRAIELGLIPTKASADSLQSGPPAHQHPGMG